MRKSIFVLDKKNTSIKPRSCVGRSVSRHFFFWKRVSVFIVNIQQTNCKNANSKPDEMGFKMSFKTLNLHGQLQGRFVRHWAPELASYMASMYCISSQENFHIHLFICVFIQNNHLLIFRRFAIIGAVQISTEKL